MCSVFYILFTSLSLGWDNTVAYLLALTFLSAHRLCYIWQFLRNATLLLQGPRCRRLNIALLKPIPCGLKGWDRDENDSVLRDPSFCSLIVYVWTSSKKCKQCFLSIQEKWDKGNSRIKSLAIAFCSKRQSERRQSCSVLAALAAHLKAKIDAGMVSLLDVYHRVLGRLADSDQSDTEGARVC